MSSLGIHNKEIHKLVGDFLRELRTDSEYTQVKLSKELGLKTSQFVSGWERGSRMPSREIMKKLIAILDADEKRVVEKLCDLYRSDLLISFDNDKKKRQV